IYFLDYCLPLIRRKLLDGIRLNISDVSVLIIKFFDEYYREVKTHMEYEERTVFSYIDSLLNGKVPQEFSIATYSDHHEQVADKLGELKNIIIKYCPDNAEANLLNDALYSIYRCERELENHCRVEDCLLVPEIKRLEREVKKIEVAEPTPGKSKEEAVADATEEESREPLSSREKEIIVNVVKGLTNKEIADKLYISVHTVITHRRNIARKLRIHSATGLTIYAIVNKIVDISELHL
ncbi:MAG: LuxR C-terminal-related transcriptional regulator, partial [Muribaculaceae bacterium]|nr:LuxR C-terminal-related transcriptional regulator [Muribaculaceae bacterium]